MTKCQKGHATVEKEAYAGIYALKKFEHIYNISDCSKWSQSLEIFNWLCPLKEQGLERWALELRQLQVPSEGSMHISRPKYLLFMTMIISVGWTKYLKNCTRLFYLFIYLFLLSHQVLTVWSYLQRFLNTELLLSLLSTFTEYRKLWTLLLKFQQLKIICELFSAEWLFIRIFFSLNWYIFIFDMLFSILLCI